MTSTDSLATRIAELETELAVLRAERDKVSADGAILKALIDGIAERRAVEEKLGQAHEWLHLAQEAGRVAAYTFDFRSGGLEWSPSTMALYGFPADETPTVERWLATIHPDDRDAATAVAEAALQRGVDVNHRFRIVRADGSISWIQDRGRIILGDDGAPARLVGINVDVTELVELQQKAHESEERLRLALAAGRNACWEWDIETGKVTWDHRLEQFAKLPNFGGSFDSFWALVHDDDKPRVRAALDRALAGEEDYSIEFRMVRSDGTVRWAATRAAIIRDSHGKPQRLVGIDTDITDRKAAEAALQGSRQFLESVLDASPDCIKVVESDGSLSFMNGNGLCAMEIASLDSVVGKQWAELWPTEGQPTIKTALAAANAGQASQFEAFCPTAQGTPRWWDVSVAPILNSDGTVERVVSISRDVTDRREADQQLHLLNAELHHRVKNNLATVQALARSTLRSTSDPKGFERIFSDRLQALGRTYGLLKAGPAASTIRELLEAELKPFFGESRALHLDGPAIDLPSTAAVSLGMIFHELTTNACKYGALAHEDGELGIRWTQEDARVTLEWAEHHSGSASPVGSSGGFGSQLMDRLARQLKGRIDRDWRPGGLVLHLTFPMPKAD